MNYDRRRQADWIPLFHEMVSKPAEADEALVGVYKAIMNFKLAIDMLGEIPDYLMPAYRHTLKVLDSTEKLKNETHQLRVMVQQIRHPKR